MQDHSNVAEIEDVSSDDEYLFRITRAKQRDRILVWISDAYLFTDIDYHNRTSELERGDFILVGKPEGGVQVDEALIEAERIGVGQIGKLMGALNARNMWEYLTPEEREERRRR
jgi:hypothetical protein